jgi:hypothetical protein
MGIRNYWVYLIVGLISAANSAIAQFRFQSLNNNYILTKPHGFDVIPKFTGLPERE